MSQQEETLYFYDLETSGFSAKQDRIMQFAGQRTDLALKPIGDPHNILVKMTEDTLPSPQAVLLTGITPQQTVTDGVTEVEFLKTFHKDIATPGTTMVGFNNIRFDDEFIRFTNYRNFYDPYEWHWKDGRSRWDVLDLVRMTRALRPKGIKWPFASDGRPSNRLEELSSLNDLLHEKAHDALSDVYATIEVAKAIKKHQPKLFEHLYAYRQKHLVKKLVDSGKPFTYTSGKYASKFLHTTLATKLVDNPNRGALVYDLRYDPEKYTKLSAGEIVKMWKHYCKERPCPHEKFPVKTIQYNRCPAVAPASVLTAKAAENINIDLTTTTAHYKKLEKLQGDLAKKVLEAVHKMDTEQGEIFANDQLAESALYDNFIGDDDKRTSRELRAAEPEALPNYLNRFDDARLKSLLPIYISKNFPHAQTDEIRQRWEKYRTHKLMSGGESSRAARYFDNLVKAAEQYSGDAEKTFLLEELQLWGQSILPVPEE